MALARLSQIQNLNLVSLSVSAPQINAIKEKAAIHAKKSKISSW